MTPHREQKIAEVLIKRQLDITVGLENVHDPHNISAVLRSCDAVGVQDVHVLNEHAPRPRKFGRKTSSGSVRWTDINYFRESDNFLNAIRGRYQKIYALSSEFSAKSIYDVDLTGSVALLFGNEKDGLSRKMLEAADETIIIPMTGMTASLNISVACAVTLYEAYRQRHAKGMYDRTQLLPEQMNIYKNWMLRELRQVRAMGRRN
ncbi:MAG: TrmH family RNA methyltransferase [Chitinophagales bacterium]|nr:TrmH family RNA methyltransferase [Chitinophagales bacterium]